MYGMEYDNIWRRYNYMKSEGANKSNYLENHL